MPVGSFVLARCLLTKHRVPEASDRVCCFVKHDSTSLPRLEPYFRTKPSTEEMGKWGVTDDVAPAVVAHLVKDTAGAT
jgi:hypothetical protein